MLRVHRQFIVLRYTAKLRGFGEAEEGRGVVQSSARECHLPKGVVGEDRSHVGNLLAGFSRDEYGRGYLPSTQWQDSLHK